MSNKKQTIEIQMHLRIQDFEDVKAEMMKALDNNPVHAIGWLSQQMITKQTEAEPFMRLKKTLASAGGDIEHPDFLKHLRDELDMVTDQLLKNRDNLCSTGMAHNMVSEYSREGKSRSRESLQSMLDFITDEE